MLCYVRSMFCACYGCLFSLFIEVLAACHCCLVCKGVTTKEWVSTNCSRFQSKFSRCDGACSFSVVCRGHLLRPARSTICARRVRVMAAHSNKGYALQFYARCVCLSNNQSLVRRKHTVAIFGDKMLMLARCSCHAIDGCCSHEHECRLGYRRPPRSM